LRLQDQSKKNLPESIPRVGKGQNNGESLRHSSRPQKKEESIFTRGTPGLQLQRKISLLTNAIRSGPKKRGSNAKTGHRAHQQKSLGGETKKNADNLSYKGLKVWRSRKIGGGGKGPSTKQ